MAGTVLPYTPAETDAAAAWLDYVAESFAGPSTPSEAVSAAREAIDKLERRGLISPGAAMLLAEIFDISELVAA